MKSPLSVLPEGLEQRDHRGRWPALLRHAQAAVWQGGEGATESAARAVPAAEQADDGPTDTLRSPAGRAMAELEIEWKDVMAFGVHSDRAVIIKAPVGYERTRWFRAGKADGGAEA